MAGAGTFVGSHATKIRAALQKGFAAPKGTAVALAVSQRRAGNRFTVSYEVQAPTPASSLNLALIQAEAFTQVERGENAGKGLTHKNVVRKFERRPLLDEESYSGSWAVRLPEDMDTFSVVAYVQDDTQLSISGGNVVALNPAR